MATVWDLSRMRTVIRKITGKFDPTQITDAEIDDHINDYYLLDFPEDMRTLKLEQYYQFQTNPNQASYPLPENYFQVKPPIYADGYQLGWYQDPELFNAVWPELKTVQNNVAAGDGGSIYSFTLFAVPIKRGTVTISTSNNQEIFNDDSNGNLVSNTSGLAAGTINYLTGVVTNLTFINPVLAETLINAHFYPYVASRPQDVLFFNQEFNFRPIPSDVFTIKVVVYIQPTTALGKSQFGADPLDTAAFIEWWQLLCYGASLKIFIEDGDHEQYQQNSIYYERQKNLAQRRALKILMNKRILTNYSTNYAGPNFPVYPIY
jgi:hypothetical protein